MKVTKSEICVQLFLITKLTELGFSNFYPPALGKYLKIAKSIRLMLLPREKTSLENEIFLRA